MQKTIETVSAYTKRGRELWKTAARDLGVKPDEMLAMQFVGWLKTKLPGLKPASRRLYLAAAREISNHLQSINPNLLIKEISAAKHELNSMKSADYSSLNNVSKKNVLNTSAQRKKRLTLKEINLLATLAKLNESKHIRAAVLWLFAGLIVGLRPCEWRNASIKQVDGRVLLEVINAKRSNGRSHGPVRTLNLSNLPENEVRLVRRQLDAVAKYSVNEKSWKQYYGNVRSEIYRITRKHFPRARRYPTLYTPRHQFAANAKSTGLAKVEIAALMGHAVDDTASMHYGRRSFGHSTCHVRADAEDVLRVTKKKIKARIQINKI